MDGDVEESLQARAHADAGANQPATAVSTRSVRLAARIERSRLRGRGGARDCRRKAPFDLLPRRLRDRTDSSPTPFERGGDDARLLVDSVGA
jgi:hypothetical protein